MIKKALSYFLDYFDNTFARYVKIESELYFLFKNNNVSFVKNLKSKFYYDLLISTTFQRPIFERKWQTTFEFDNKYTGRLYMYLKLCMSLY